MKSVLCKANDKKIKEREDKREREIIEKVRRQKPWPEPPPEKEPEPKKDKEESS